MKLIRAYIENFGKISKTEYDFSNDLTSFCYENGYGKTTLATFIKAMFYGLPAVTKSTKFNDREHYFPFDGGKFGGNLIFEKGQEIYKIVRFFDKKSEVKDEITLYKNDNEVKTLPENIGKWVFGVDEASYLRTLYYTEASSIKANTSDITFKLTGVIESDDEESFERAKKSLEEVQKTLKKTGNKGQIFETKQEILKVSEEIQNLKSIDGALDIKYQEKADLESKLKKLESELKRVSDLKIKQDNFKTYETYLVEAKKVEAEIQKIEADYVGGLLTESEISNLYECCDELNKLDSEKEYITPSTNLINEYNKLKKTFEKGVPTKNDIEKLKDGAQKALNENNQSNKVKNYPLLLIGIVELIVASVLLFLNVNFGILMLGVGALFIANAFLLKSPNKKDNEALNEIDSNLKNYEIFNNNLLAGVYELENKIDRYHALNKEVYSKTERVNAIIKLKEEKINYINRVFSKCGLVIYKTDSLKEQIKAVENDLITIKNKKQYYKDLINKAENYKKEKSLDVKPESTGSYDEINQECDELRKQISYIERVIKSGEDSLETLGLKKNYLEELQEREAMLIKRYKDVTLTLEYFLKAEESLKNKFVYPVKESFIKYSSKLEKVFGEKVTMDKNFEVYFERGGENKSREYLSAGQNVLCDLCLRLALIDNMYKEENPFIILDDPFITLDENYIKKALLLLSELKTDRQIIYFTCHKSREIS